MRDFLLKNMMIVDTDINECDSLFIEISFIENLILCDLFSMYTVDIINNFLSSEKYNVNYRYMEGVIATIRALNKILLMLEIDCDVDEDFDCASYDKLILEPEMCLLITSLMDMYCDMENMLQIFTLNHMFEKYNMRIVFESLFIKFHKAIVVFLTKSLDDFNIEEIMLSKKMSNIYNKMSLSVNSRVIIDEINKLNVPKELVTNITLKSMDALKLTVNMYKKAIKFFNKK